VNESDLDILNNSNNKHPGWMQKLLLATRTSWNTFKLKEKIVMVGMIMVGIFLILAGLWSFSNDRMVVIAKSGGKLTEGLIGSPRFINPLLATSDTDKDLTALIYSGLLRIGPDGSLIPDLAESYEISDDGLTYTFTLKPGLTWHDGRKLTARDVVFTVSLAQNENTRSSKRPVWDGVTVEQSGEKTIIFRLNQPYAPFLENMTMGILPTHLWTNIEPGAITFSDLNTMPIGSGPYQINKIKKNRDGIPTHYNLKAFKDFALGAPLIRNIQIRFYPNENELINALNRKEIESAHSLTPAKMEEINLRGKQVVSEKLPRIFGLFFNQNQVDIFTRKEVREALDISIPREKIVGDILHGYAIATSKAILIPAEEPKEQTEEDNLMQAESILKQAGWSKNENGVMRRTVGDNETTLSFAINTSDNPELKAIAELIKEEWEKLGARIEIKIFDSGNLNQTVIRPRNYDSLLFGMVTGRHPDPYAFWHSSQRIDPGLNIALYANITTDRILENLRTTIDKERQIEYLNNLNSEISDDIPASFIYAPKFVYILPNEIKDVSILGISEPSDRFANIYNWYRKTQKVWPIFTKENNIIED